MRWEGLTGEGLPNPLIITTDIESHDAYMTARRRVAAEINTQDDPELDAVLLALTRPEIVVEIFGITAPDTGDERAIRVYAASAGGRCFTVRQRPGKSIFHAAGFTVSEHNPAAWAADIVGFLPALGPGRQAMVPLPDPDGPQDITEGIDYGYGRSEFRDSFDDSATENHSGYLDKPITGAGSIDVIQGRSIFGPAGRGRRAVGWRDLADDGRYTIVYRAPCAARAADTASFTALLTDEIEEIQLLVDDERRSVHG
ncbi:ESX secretion-associated protein EspG [Nocardia flavorosea]|uniref:ESX secretion-associated protein EspG n=1 Tax=Nocardia flavorosea TaxID=53429 RepID=UPI0018961531|nr:ESX secretion-associated protein EspG [Nocardia flavorosea]MBF6351431.1 ESX secretion-associated protein EspG [Nocardia flavorosea]